MKESLKDILKYLPNSPGVYQYFDKEGKIIYVGKAKNLKKRVSSYFLGHLDHAKTRLLVKNIEAIKHIVVETEEDALLLENNLIKKYQPRYNVLLKDDKTFPWIVIKNESFPRVFYTRKVVKDGSFYFGPYTSMVMVRTLLDLFRTLYPIRTCKLNLDTKNIKQGKYRVCLEYHIDKCKGPCIGKYSVELYNQHIREIKNILKGNISSVISFMKELMLDYAKDYKFEDAELVKQKISLLNNYRSKSSVVSASIHNVDVFSIVDDEYSGFVNFLKVIDGAIIQVHTIEIKKKLNETKEELLSLAIADIRARLNSKAKDIIVPFMPDVHFDSLNFLIPKKGEKKILLELSERNVKYFKLERLKQKANNKKITSEERILNTLKKDLQLSKAPSHIECFDNSNIQGHYPVSACVVFKNGKPSKRDYRHYHVKTVEGPDDFASMKEIVFRRYKRLKEEGSALPQLIIIDGGKGQLSAAYDIIQNLGLESIITIIGIAKKLEEIFFPDDPVPLYLDKNSESLKVIQHARNEAHRFGITFHRNQRSNDFIKSELDKIPHIGQKTVQKLLAQFQSVEVVKQKSEEELIQCIGKSKAKIVSEYFYSKK